MKQVTHANCVACPLLDAKLVRGRGPKNPRAIVIGEGPGDSEVKQGLPFVGDAGQILRDVLSQYGNINPDECFYTNATLCLPTRGEAKEEAVSQAVECCKGRLEAELAQFPDDIPVLALGRHAQRALGVSELRWEYEQLTGKWALGTLHPAALLYSDGRGKPIHLFEAVRKFGKERQDTPLLDPYNEKDVARFVNPYPLPELNGEWGRVAIDIETVGEWYDPAGRILLVGIHSLGGPTVILTEDYANQPESQAWLRAMFAQHGQAIGGHNFKYDILWLHHKFGCPLIVGWDTMSMINCWHEEFFKGLKDLSTFFFDALDYEKFLVKDELEKWVQEEKARRPKGQKTIATSEKSYDKVPPEKLQLYLFCDIVYTLPLSFELETLLKEEGRWLWPYLNHDLPQVQELCEVEYRGIGVDVPRLQQEQEAMGKDVEALKTEILKLSDGLIENPGSDEQVRTYLFKQLKRKPGRRTPTGKYSVNAEVLQDHKDEPVVHALLAYRRVVKLKSSYVDTIIGRPAEGKKPAKAGCVFPDKYGTMRVHPSINHATVRTHRLSVKKPAAQTLPHRDETKDILPNWLAADTGLAEDGDYGGRIKNCYIPAPGYTFVQVDGAGFEYYGAAAQTLAMGYTDLMCEEIQRGGDPHKYLCDMMWGEGWTKSQRVLTKNVNFGYGLYLGSPQAISAITGLDLEVVKEAAKWLDENLGGGIRRWQADLYEQAQKVGYLTVPHFNYCVHFDLITDKNVEEVRKLVVSYINQGLCSMIMSRAAMLAAPKLRRLGGYVVALVHDSYLVEVPDGMVEQALDIMMDSVPEAGNEVVNLVPWHGEGEVGKRWGELKRVR